MAEAGNRSRAGLLERVLDTRAARVAAWILLAFVTAAAWAPFLASDRPLHLRAVDHGGFESARSSLAAVTTEWAAIAGLAPADWSAQHPPRARDAAATDVERHARALALQRRAVEERIARLRTYARDEDARVLDLLDAALRAGRASAATSAAEAAARSLGSSIGPNTGSGATLVPRTSFPLLAETPASDAAFALAWCVALATWIVRRVRGRPWRNARTAWLPAAVVFLATWVAWRPLAGDPEPVPAYKAALASGALRAEAVAFAWIPYGPTETNLSESHRAPTWLASGALAAYARDAATDPGLAARFDASAPRDVRVLPGEPAADSAWRHVAGTDSLGRDLASRLLWGTRTSLVAGFASALLLTVLGTLLGAWAGWKGGVVDLIVSRVLEVVLCFPAFVLALCALFFFDPRVVSPLVAIVIVIGLVGWPGVARLVRAECLRVREMEFVVAARACGLRESAILARHVLPHALPPAFLAFSFAVGAGVLAESALSFLGLMGNASAPSFGAIVADARGPDHAWSWIVPGACVFALVASVTLLGEALRDAWNPRHVGAAAEERT